MISSILKRDIDAYADWLRDRSPLLARAREGKLPADAVARYLASIRYLLTQTPVHLHLARARATDLGAHALARYFDEKLGEEAGHDEWASSDLEHLERAFGVSLGGVEPAAAMLELVEHTRALITDEPHSYLAYILFAEYLTVVLGPEWVAALTRRCGVPEAAMTAVTRHVELDRTHVLEGCAEIDALVTEPALHERLKAMLGGTMARFTSFCEELAAA